MRACAKVRVMLECTKCLIKDYFIPIMHLELHIVQDLLHTLVTDDDMIRQ